MGNNRQEFADVIRFVRSCFMKTGRAPFKLELIHSSGSDGALVQYWSDFKNSDGPESIADEIINAAEEDAKIYTGIQTYIIIYFDKDERDIAGRKGFRIQGQILREGIDGESEPPNERGYTSQMMRHNEGITKLNLHSLNQIHAKILQSLERKDDIIERLVSKQFDTLITLEQLLDRKQERDLKLKEQEQEQQLRGRIFERIDSALPSFMGKLLPDSPGVKKMQGEAFFQSLSEKQIDDILIILDEKQSKNFAKALLKQDIELIIVIFSRTLTDEQNIKMSQILNPTQFAALAEVFEQYNKKNAQTNGVSHDSK